MFVVRKIDARRTDDDARSQGMTSEPTLRLSGCRNIHQRCTFYPCLGGVVHERQKVKAKQNQVSACNVRYVVSSIGATLSISLIFIFNPSYPQAGEVLILNSCQHFGQRSPASPHTGGSVKTRGSASSGNPNPNPNPEPSSNQSHLNGG